MNEQYNKYLKQKARIAAAIAIFIAVIIFIVGLLAVFLILKSSEDNSQYVIDNQMSYYKNIPNLQIIASTLSDTTALKMFRSDYMSNDGVYRFKIYNDAINYDTNSVNGSTYSMYPTIMENMCLVLTPDFNDDDVKVGNIFVFTVNSTEISNKTRILHRIVEIDGDKIYTKGDNNKYMDADYRTKADLKEVLLATLYHPCAKTEN